MRASRSNCWLLAAAITLLGALAPPMPALEQSPPPVFSLPVACEIGRRCVVQNYFDHEAGPGAQDYACGSLSYDGHRGTDFRVADLAAMTEGVPVLAAAAGVVRAIRDGMSDIDARDIDRATIEGREAGNAVVISHGDGWESQYSHLRRGSVAVAQGDRVEAGQTLGLIGMSGLAEFPHVHFEVRLNDRHVDPFIGLAEPRGCAVAPSALWAGPALAALDYSPGGLLSLGFAPQVPDFPAIRRGDLRADWLPGDAAALVFWFNFYGVQDGDVVSARLLAPDGSVVAERRQILERRQAQWFGYIGRRRPGGRPLRVRHEARRTAARFDHPLAGACAGGIPGSVRG